MISTTHLQVFYFRNTGYFATIFFPGQTISYSHIATFDTGKQNLYNLPEDPALLAKNQREKNSFKQLDEIAIPWYGNIQKQTFILLSGA